MNYPQIKRIKFLKNTEANIEFRQSMVAKILNELGPMTKDEIIALVVEKNNQVNKETVKFWLSFMRNKKQLIMHDKRDCKITGRFQNTYTTKQWLDADGGTNEYREPNNKAHI
jgi:hypothetical protein